MKNVLNHTFKWTVEPRHTESRLAESPNCDVLLLCRIYTEYEQIKNINIVKLFIFKLLFIGFISKSRAMTISYNNKKIWFVVPVVSN